MRLIFLFSLPRAGSTLLQRMLAAHDDVATLSETKLLLPLVYTMRDRGIYTEYIHASTVAGIQDLCNQLPGGRNDYLAEMRGFVLRLYAKAAGGNVKYFMDKTTRYSHIVEEVIQLFPDAKYIFLWRNPLAIVASIMTTWADGRWNLFSYKAELFDGLANLVSAYRSYADRSIAVRYEDVLLQPEVELHRLDEYLNLPYDPRQLTGFANVQLIGRLGDPTGVEQYERLSKEPLEKWKRVLTNPIRTLWCRRYLRWIGEERLGLMGYDLNVLLADLNNTPIGFRYMSSDLWNQAYGIAYCVLEPRINKHKLQALPAWHRVYAHR